MRKSFFLMLILLFAAYSSAKSYTLEKAQVKLPEKFIDLLFQEEYAERKDKLTEEQLKEEKIKFNEKIIWSLITDRISKDNNLDADEKEILSETYLFLNNYLYMYGQQSLPDNVMAEYITNYLKDKNNLSVHIGWEN